MTSIIVPTFENEEFTIKCFDSVIKNTKNYQIVWVDNGSSGGSVNRITAFLLKNKGVFHLIRNDKNLGFVKATNQGIEFAIEKSEHIVFLNNDVMVYSNWLETMISALADDVGAVGPITNPCGMWQSVDKLKATSQFVDLPDYYYYPNGYARSIARLYGNRTCYANWPLAYFCVLFRSEVLKKVGYLSEEYGVGLCDDNDHCMVLMKAGFKLVIAKGAFVVHGHRSTFKKVYKEKKIKEMIKNNNKICKEKHPELAFVKKLPCVEDVVEDTNINS